MPEPAPDQGAPAPGGARPGAAAALCLLLAAAVALSSFKAEDPDTFWHLKTGQVILAERRIPRTNLFSDLHAGYPAENPEWLFQVALALVHAAWGWSGVTAANVLLTCGITALLFSLLRARGSGPLEALALAAFALSLMRFRLVARPHLVSYVLFLLVMHVALRCRDRRVFVLPPLFALWSNVHPEFVLGLAWLASTGLGAWLDRRRGGEGLPGGRALAAAAALCLPATLLNPEGHRALLFGIPNPFVPEVIDLGEFRWASPEKVPFLWVLFALGAAAVWVRRGRWRAAELLPAAGLAGATIAYVRALPYCAFTASVVLSRCLRPAQGGEGRRGSARALLAATAACAVASFVWAMRFDRLIPYRPGWGLEERLYPAAAADRLLSRPFPRRLYNHYPEGGYLLYRLYPRMGVFQDGRAHAYPPDFLAPLHARHGESPFQAQLDAAGANTAVIRQDELKFFPSREEWPVAFWDDSWVILVRRIPAAAALLAECEYRLFLPGGDPRTAAGPGLFAPLLAEMERNQRERRSPSATVQNWIGLTLGSSGRPREAEAAYRRAIELDPALVSAWFNLGLALAGQGRRDEAMAALREASRLDPGHEMSRRMLQAIGSAPSGGFRHP